MTHVRFMKMNISKFLELTCVRSFLLEIIYPFVVDAEKISKNDEIYMSFFVMNAERTLYRCEIYSENES